MATTNLLLDDATVIGASSTTSTMKPRTRRDDPARAVENYRSEARFVTERDAVPVGFQ
jgi:hypothetical protein